MGSSLPIKFAFLFSLSVAGTAAVVGSSPPQFPRKLTAYSSSSHASSSPTNPKATCSDLLAVLGPPHQAKSVDSQVARELWSCFKFLAPFDEVLPTRRVLCSNSIVGSSRRGREADELILSPPNSVLELARIAVDSGADPGAIQRALDPTIIPVPDIEGSNEDKCQLTRTPYGRLFADEGLNSYLELLFEIIVERGPSVGLNVSLSRFDLFHGHLFIEKMSGRLGILFHAKEYPAYDKKCFPFNMGYCQVGSNVAYDDSMNLRNILWLAPLPSNSTDTWLAPGVLVVLDAHPEGIIYRDLIPDYVKYARTLYEEDLGELVFDVNYLNKGGEGPKFQIFIC
ncbi:uncharacterized protein LOC127262558 [Andrographis paniculata]|uniref:uncharacterized protein LOC127262558 n=1 Tax=Andrographis paniculata TaxID=175694 RepID=UPI0021E903D3|nr:uncharacterized protein LOC127262558 [Andrographis paniculata]XP_051147247.1 uncharacterized protein LOC127262558 [Andrographis paniculata]XP_051147248.1 uncharacterized protein LOC127262558 [Andrographis paniculata]